MIPVHFDDCAGWLHGAVQAPKRRGVVIAPGYGFEDLCSRRALRILADRLADRGVATLRFDFHGTGDSGGDIGEPDRLDRWRGNLDAAIERLRMQTGVDDITLVGLRFGAWLAMEVAAARDDIATVVAVAPPGSGKAYLREMSTLGRIIGQVDGVAPTAGVTSVAGFELPEALGVAIRAYEPARLTRRPAPRVLLIGREATPVAEPLRARLVELGANVETRGFAGYDRMMCDPTASQVPLDTLAEIGNWIAAGAAGRAAMPSVIPRIDSHRVEGPDYQEESIRFGPEGRLAGILCQPKRAKFRATPAALITNAGGIHHVGWGRMGVEHARALAEAGIASLRMDFAGLGDSRVEYDLPDVDYYRRDGRDDVSLGIDVLAARGHERIFAVGACAGAYQAFHAAVDDPRIDGLVLVNQLCFVWDRQHAMPLAAWKRAKAFDMAVKARAADEDLADIARLRARLTAKAVALAKSGARSVLAIARDISHRLNAPIEAEAGVETEVADWFQHLSRRGTRVVMLHGEADGAREELAHYMGPDGARATALPGVSLAIIPATDHPLTPKPARAALLSATIAAIGADLPAERRATARVAAGA